MAILANDDVVVHYDPERACDLHDHARHLDVSA
jgi:hypothetical protein